MSMSVLHVEVGGSYGGSLRALELYLKYSDRRRVSHDLLFYYPTPAAERLRPLVRSVRVLGTASPPGERGRVRRLLPHPPRGLVDSLVLARQLPWARRVAAAIRASGCDVVHCNNSFSYQPAT
ncbi:MAG TPA: hypothetical protein VNF74_10580, partial [Terriglobales bacterium]|nr:hypothetical protein [Terriglobales bacterium]